MDALAVYLHFHEHYQAFRDTGMRVHLHRASEVEVAHFYALSELSHVSSTISEVAEWRARVNQAWEPLRFLHMDYWRPVRPEVRESLIMQHYAACRALDRVSQEAYRVIERAGALAELAAPVNFFLIAREIGLKP